MSVGNYAGVYAAVSEASRLRAARTTRMFEPHTIDSRGWMVDASCASLPAEAVDELLFPVGGAHLSRTVQKMCAACPVQAECAEYGKGQAYGVWGGVPHSPYGVPAVA